MADEGRATTCDYTVRHPRSREAQRSCIWVTVEGWQGEHCLCVGCREYLRVVGKTVTNVDPEFRSVA